MNGGMGEKREVINSEREEILFFITLRKTLTLHRTLLSLLEIIDAQHIESYRIKTCRGL